MILIHLNGFCLSVVECKDSFMYVHLYIVLEIVLTSKTFNFNQQLFSLDTASKQRFTEKFSGRKYFCIVFFR